MPSRVRRIRKTTIGTLNAVADLQRVHPGSEELFTPSLDASDFPEGQRDAPQQFLQWGDVAELQDIAVSAVPRGVIAPIQELPQSGAEEAPFEGESKESSETDRTSISPEQEACQCHGNEGDVECDCVCYIPNTPISQRPKAKVIPQAHATSDVSVNTEDIDEVFQCGQVLDCSSTNSSLEAVDHINRPEQITVVEDEALFEFCAETSRRHTVSNAIHRQLESKVDNLQKHIDSLVNAVGALQATNTSLFDLVTSLVAALTAKETLETAAVERTH
ncbi:uncharacterized protein LOC120567686 [Perca fluviatilis]|uniref:uncharacterized protein LOC120567686 n=1 Tax=Perca fluviatilis TaxID=8168 RepID=UPI0019626823|nr:uncharacterized protein LOC120567686 [Perca fluviatilis]